MSRGLVAGNGFPLWLAGVERNQGRSRANRGVFGYPEGWPAGPWIVPLFWIAVLLAALALRFAAA
jgi:hypothetical protein